MDNKIFIISDAAYSNGFFPKVPDYRKRDSWFMLTEGIANDIIVDDRTTVKQIRKGRYERLVEISKKTYSTMHTFNSPCQETSYTFKVTIKANVFVNDPNEFYSNVRNMTPQDYFNNQFSQDVRKIARNYSILDYSGMDDDLLDILPRNTVFNDVSGLAYQIQTVEITPNEAALKVLERMEKDKIENYLKEQEMLGANKLKKSEMEGVAAIGAYSSELAKINKGVTYEDAIWGEVATGNYTRVQAIEKIDKYKNQTRAEKLQSMLELRDRNVITSEDMDMYKEALMPELNRSNVDRPVAIAQQADDTIVDEYYQEG